MGPKLFFGLMCSLKGGKLCVKFKRLFDLSSETRLMPIADMFSLGWGVGGDTWKWWRRLLVWEDEQRVL